MDLIEGIEIGYFRSIYKEKLDGLRGLTVLFGRNDSGKSNFLRALNLFFEGQTNPGLAFNFIRDFSHARLDEVNKSDGARKFIYIKIYFRAPTNWRNSLGSSFWVKKQWSVTREAEPVFETSVPSARQQYLTRFLNNVKFHYIPAIKDRSIFERLLGSLYGVLSRQTEFNQSLNSFSEEVRRRTEVLSQGILGALGVNSAIAPPSDLTELFKSLDFDTVGVQGDSYSLTLQRGDGIQVRHIPEILSFLSDRGHEDYHIWGFEEPENSLELAAAIDEAARFVKLSRSSNKQIFVTSHSPAFFRLREYAVNRYFIVKTFVAGLSRDVSLARKIDGISADSVPADLMGETPHLAIISSYLDEAARKIDSLQFEAKELIARINETSTPILFVEGESDAKVLREAWVRYVGDGVKIQIESCAGTSKMQSLAANGGVLKTLAPERRMFVLVDNDGEGRNLRADSRLHVRGGVWAHHNSNKTSWCRLWATDEFVAEMESMHIQASSWPATLENVFSKEMRLKAISEGAYVIGPNPFADLLNSENFPKIREKLAGMDSDKLYVMAPTPGAKETFAEWIVKQDGDALLPLRQIVLGLQSLLQPESTE